MKKFATRREYIAGVCIALFVLVGTAWAVAPSFRADGGVRMAKSSSAGTTPTAANPVVWSDNATRPNLRFGDGTSNEYVAACAVTTNGDICTWNGSNWVRSAGGGGLTWPITNGTSTNTYTSAVPDGATAHQHIFDSTGCATDGCMAYEFRSGTNNWVTVGRENGAHKFKFFGDSDSAGAGPMLIKSTAASAGLTLDATTAGGRIYQQYSTASGLYVLADLTAGANRWAMDSNGAYYPYADNAVNLGLPGNRPAALYTYKVDATDTITQNIASVSGQQAGASLIASTAATSSGTQSNSPGMLFRSQAWNSTALAGQAMDWMIQSVPTAGNPVTGQISTYSQANAGGWTERFRVTPTRATALNGMVVSQGFAGGYRTAATAVTVANTDRFVGVTGTGVRSVNLPAANTCLAAGQEFVIQEVGGDAGAITINRASTDTINGATSISIATAYGRKTLFCNGSNAWFASSATN
jgi:hypothetical protein